jgi:hypothetical protein
LSKLHNPTLQFFYFFILAFSLKTPATKVREAFLLQKMHSDNNLSFSSLYIFSITPDQISHQSPPHDTHPYFLGHVFAPSPVLRQHQAMLPLAIFHHQDGKYGPRLAGSMPLHFFPL